LAHLTQKFDFKATPAERSDTEQVMHVVIVDNQVMRLLRPSTPGLGAGPDPPHKWASAA